MKGNTAYADGKKVQIDLAAAIRMTGETGPLNPTWVEWLMGWLAEWTDCELSATVKFQHLHGGR